MNDLTAFAFRFDAVTADADEAVVGGENVHLFLGSQWALTNRQR
jgi:hypothetical protein